MKLVTFEVGSRLSWGAYHDGDVLDLGSALDGECPDVLGALSLDRGRLEAAAEKARRLSLDEVAFAPVLPNPGKIFCVGHNYDSHRKETGRDKTDHPSIFTRFPDSQVGHRRALVRPKVSTMFDFEGELALVIGRAGRAISEADALGHVAGYACYNDASVRDWQWHTKQFTPGKNFPGTGAFGPWLITADEVPDPSTLRVTTRVNGAVMQDQPTSDLIFPIPVLIAYISQFTPLAPGDVIVTGTPGGVGAKREPPVWLKAGDVVEVSIPGVGHLVNTVEDER